MASGFWYLKDGRGFAKRLQIMIHMLNEIHNELIKIPGAEEFTNYIIKFIPSDEHELNGFGGFYDINTGKNTMMVIDFREFTTENQHFFWEAVQSKINKLHLDKDRENQIMLNLFIELSKMNKEASIGKNPKGLNNLITTIEPSGNKLGPGWSLDLKLKFNIDKPKSGWLPISLEYDNFKIDFEASDVPNNCIENLITALLVLETKEFSESEFHLEPVWIKFNFEKFEKYYSIEIIKYENEINFKTLRIIEGNFSQIIEPIVDMLKRFLELKTYILDWEPIDEEVTQNFNLYITEKTKS